MNYIEEAEKIFRRYTGDRQDSWIMHSQNVANAAHKIAKKAGLDAGRAYSYGLLHDIGRSRTDGQFAHIVLGYEMMSEMGLTDIAKICLTHSFPVQNVYSYVGALDASESKVGQFQELLMDCRYDDYDLLIQLCDAISTDIGYICLEKRFVNNVFKYGFNEYTVEKWKKTLAVKEYFEQFTGNIFKLLSREEE